VAALIHYSGLSGTEQPDLLAEIIEIFIDTTPQTIGQFKTAVASGDLATLKRVVHSLKGTVGTFGAIELAAKCRALHQKLLHGDEDLDLQAESADLLQEYERVCDEMRQLGTYWKERKVS